VIWFTGHACLLHYGMIAHTMQIAYGLAQQQLLMASQYWSTQAVRSLHLFHFLVS